MVEEVVRAVAQVHVGDDAVDRVEAVVVGEVQVVAPPLLGLRAAGAVHELVEVGAVLGQFRGEMLLPGLGAVGVAVGEAAFSQKRAVGVLHHHVEAPEVAVVLALGAGLVRAADDAPVDPVGVGAGHAREVIRAEGNGLVHAGHAAIDLHPRAGAAAQVQVVPRPDVRLAPVVLRGELMRAREVNAPLGLAADVGAGLAAILELHVVEDLAIADEGAKEPALVVAAVPLAALHVVVPREEVIDRERGEKGGGELERRSLAGLRRAGPRGHAVVAEPCKVRAFVVGVGQADAGAGGLCEENAVA